MLDTLIPCPLGPTVRAADTAPASYETYMPVLEDHRQNQSNQTATHSRHEAKITMSTFPRRDTLGFGELDCQQGTCGEPNGTPE